MRDVATAVTLDGVEPVEPLDDDFPTTAKIRRVTARRLRAVRNVGGFQSVDLLLSHLCKLAETDPAILLRGRAR